MIRKVIFIIKFKINMKHLRILLLACIACVMATGCGLKKMITRYPEVNIRLDDQDLENKGGQVAYQVKGTIPPKYMKKKSTMTVVPTIEYQGQQIALAPIEIKGEKAKNAEAYESIHELVVGSLSAVPVTIAELWDAIKEEVPAGITKGKVQYAVTHLWESEIVKIEGKPNTYRKA